MRSDDEVLVTRCLEGDQPAFAFLVNKYKEVVHAYAYRKVGDYQQAEDITQEVFIKAYRKLAQLKWPHRFQSWLYTITSNECKMWFRTHSKEREQEVPWEDVPVDNLDKLAVRVHSYEDIKLTVESAMETLPDDRQLALSLFYMSSLSVKEIAHFMGVSPNSVKIKLHRARKQLGERLEKMIGKQLRKEKLKAGFVFKLVDSIRDMPIPSLPKPRPIKWAPIPISIGVALLIGVIGFGMSSGRDVSQDMPGLKPAETTYEVSLMSDPDEQVVLDIETVGNELVALNSGDDTATEAGRSPNIGITVRKVAVMDNHYGAPSPDGRYLSFTDWGSPPALAVHDLTTGEYRNLTSEGTWVGPYEQWADDHSIWSPDSKQVAYTWYHKDRYQLRIVGLDRSEPRVLYPNENKELSWIEPHEWSRDGKSILAAFWKKTDPKGSVQEMVLVSVADGSVRILKSFDDDFWADRMSLSPDGRCVVYDHYEKREEPHDIFLLATDGSGEIPLVEHPANDYGPVWSPDGKSIVFVSDRSGTNDAWLLQMIPAYAGMGRPVGEPTLVKKNMGFPIGFTRSGSLYYAIDAGGQDVYIATLDPATGKLLSSPTKAIRRFEGFNRAPAWSPDGKYLAYLSRRNVVPTAEEAISVLVIRSMETGDERELHDKLQKAVHLHWSPDGRSILIGFRNGFGLIDVQTGDVTPITRAEGPGGVWSPDGKTIFYIPRRIESQGGFTSIVAHDLKTSRKQELRRDVVGGYLLAISPDGRQLAFTDGWQVLMAMPAAGGEPREILRIKDPEGFCWGAGLTWTPDGRYILFGKGDPHELWRIPVEGGKPQKLLAMDGLAHVSIHPDGQRIAFTGGKGGSEVWVMENFLPGFTADK